MKKTNIIAVTVFVFMCIASCVARAGDVFSVEPIAGVIALRGEALGDITPLVGIQADWEIDDTFGLRLGVQYAKVDVDDGSNLKLSRFPLMITTPLRKHDGVLRNFYMGFGGVATIAHYSDGHYPDVNKFGPAALVGVKLCKHFSAELSFDSMKRYGRQYGGYSLIFTYEGL